VDSAVSADELHIIALPHLDSGGIEVFALIQPTQPDTVDPVVVPKTQGILEYLIRPEPGIRTLAGDCHTHEQGKEDHSLPAAGCVQIGQPAPPT
jgi:hypothetical protein